MTPEQIEMINRALDAIEDIADTLKEFVRLIDEEVRQREG